MKKKSRARRRFVSDLSEEEISVLWEIFDFTYDDVDEMKFRQDLLQKERVITLHDSKDQRILGFSTVVLSPEKRREKKVWVLFSGDTALREEAWGDRSLVTGFFLELIRFQLLHPFTPIYWLLISKGYKTYLLLTRNFPVHWPRHDAKTPKEMEDMMRSLVRSRFDSVEDKGNSIFILPPGNGKVKRGIAPLTEDLLKISDIRFFNDANPDHASGYELCCLGLVNLRLFLKMTMKILKGPARSRKRSAQNFSSKNRFRFTIDDEAKHA